MFLCVVSNSLVVGVLCLVGVCSNICSDLCNNEVFITV